MNNQLDVLTQCPVCLEAYEDSGERVPRILPCHCTLCEECIKKLLNDHGFLTCPLDNEIHRASDEAKTFKQNKYIISYLKSTAATNPQETKPRQTEVEYFQRCKLHDRELSLFCREELCKKLICTLCLVEEHLKHPFVDIAQEERDQTKSILEEIEFLRECLQSKLALLDNLKMCTTHHEKFHELEEKQDLKLGLLESVNLDHRQNQLYKNFPVSSDQEHFTNGATLIGCKGIPFDSGNQVLYCVTSKRPHLGLLTNFFVISPSRVVQSF